MTLDLAPCEPRRFEMRVGRKSAAVDDILIEHCGSMIDRIEPSAWWFDRLHSDLGTALRLYFRPKRLPNEAEVAEQLLYLDGLTLTATSRASNGEFGFAPRPDDRTALGGGSEQQSVGAFCVQTGPNAARSIEQLRPFERLLQSCSELALEVLRREHDECTAVRKDCAVTIAEYLLKSIAGTEEASSTLATVLDRWTKSAPWGTAYLDHLYTTAAHDLPIDSIHGTRNRFFAEHPDLARKLVATIEREVGLLSTEGQLQSRRDRADAFQIAAHAILNQLGFSDADILYIAFILRRLGY